MQMPISYSKEVVKRPWLREVTVAFVFQPTDKTYNGDFVLAQIYHGPISSDVQLFYERRLFLRPNDYERAIAHEYALQKSVIGIAKAAKVEIKPEQIEVDVHCVGGGNRGYFLIMSGRKRLAINGAYFLETLLKSDVMEHAQRIEATSWWPRTDNLILQ